MQLSRRSLLVAAAAATALVVLVTPVGALAGNGKGCSACQVYTEEISTGGGGTPIGATGEAVPLSKGAGHVLARSGKDKGVLKPILTDPGFGATRGLESVSAEGVSSPGALGAVFDVGYGPVVLFAILLATALGLALRGSLRGWRRIRS